MQKCGVKGCSEDAAFEVILYGRPLLSGGYSRVARYRHGKLPESCATLLVPFTTLTSAAYFTGPDARQCSDGWADRKSGTCCHRLRPRAPFSATTPS